MAVKVKSGQLGMATPFGELLGASDAQMNAELNDYVALGVDWLRIDIHWDLVQPTANGGYNWSLVDRVFNAAAAKGIEIIAVLGNNPNWVDPTFSTTAAQTAYANFAKTAAQHFGDKVDYWEIYNEPNLVNITPANYTKMLKGAYNAIKAYDSGDVVITGGTAAVPSTGNGMYGAVDYLQQIYANGGKGYFDAVGYHPYTYPLTPTNNSSWNGWEIMETGLRNAMIANGDSAKQIWMTELGSPTSGGDERMTAGLQTTILREAVDIAKAHSWAGPILWYSYQDRGGSGSNQENWFGLLRPDGSKKEAYNLFKQLGNADNGAVTNDNAAIKPPTNATPDSSSDSGSSVHKFTSGSGTFTLNSFESGDKIDLRAVDANILQSGNQDFNFIGSNWLSKTKDVGVYHDRANGYTYLQANTDADTSAELTIKIKGVHTLTADSLLLNSSGTVYKITHSSGMRAISDYEKGDKIDLSGIDANRLKTGVQDFKYIGANWLADEGDLGVYHSTAANKTFVMADTNGDGTADFSIELAGLHSLTQNDFIF